MPFVEHRQAEGDPASARLDDLGRLLSDWLWETDRDLNLTYFGPRVLDALLYHPKSSSWRGLMTRQRGRSSTLGCGCGQAGRRLAGGLGVRP
jgi:hypothetical protein